MAIDVSVAGEEDVGGVDGEVFSVEVAAAADVRFEVAGVADEGGVAVSFEGEVGGVEEDLIEEQVAGAEEGEVEVIAGEEVVGLDVAAAVEFEYVEALKGEVDFFVDKLSNGAGMVNEEEVADPVEMNILEVVLGVAQFGAVVVAGVQYYFAGEVDAQGMEGG